LKFGDPRDLHVGDDAGHARHLHVDELPPVSPDQLVAQGKIADRDFGAGIDDRVERRPGGFHLGQDQLTAPNAASGDPALRFEIGADGKVSLIHVGTMPVLGYVEGCA
jgi:hypothetical protein